MELAEPSLRVLATSARAEEPNARTNGSAAVRNSHVSSQIKIAAPLMILGGSGSLALPRQRLSLRHQIQHSFLRKLLVEQFTGHKSLAHRDDPAAKTEQFG
jgi:hypothetical protein